MTAPFYHLSRLFWPPLYIVPRLSVRHRFLCPVRPGLSDIYWSSGPMGLFVTNATSGFHCESWTWGWSDCSEGKLAQLLFGFLV